ncbi:MAG: hypothetical protein RIQ60_480 [Pseudomonadota bacterium]|jgi:hypothetical protein
MPTSALEAARLDMHQHDDALRDFHGFVHAQLRSDRKDEILKRARERIGLWKQGKLCSAYYIRFWSAVVALGDSAVFKARVLDASPRRATGLMQNTPFFFLLRERR